jgi:hypothetical protein
MTERLRVRQDLHLHDALQQLIGEVEQELHRWSVLDPWCHSMPLRVQLPGVGVIDRFPSAKHLVGYAGLGASVQASGQTHRGGRITKAGRRDLRTVLGEVAWIAVAQHPQWKAQYQQLAIARKLLVVIWPVLSPQQPDRHADPQAVSRKLMTWISRSGRTTPGKNRSRLLRLRDHLDRLQLPVREVTYSGVTYMLPPASTG